MYGGDIVRLISYVARKVYGPQGTEPEFDETHDYDDEDDTENENRAEYNTYDDSDYDLNHDDGY